MGKITKKEKQGIVFIIIGIVVFAFLTDPITNFVASTFQRDSIRFLIGIALIFGLAWWGRLNNILR